MRSEFSKVGSRATSLRDCSENSAEPAPIGRGEKALAIDGRESSKSWRGQDRTRAKGTEEEPQFFPSFVLASGVAGYRWWPGIYRRPHSFLLTGHFIRTGSWLSLSASLRLDRGRYRINVSLITYPAVATPPFSSIGVPLLLHIPRRIPSVP